MERLSAENWNGEKSKCGKYIKPIGSLFLRGRDRSLWSYNILNSRFYTLIFFEMLKLYAEFIAVLYECVNIAYGEHVCWCCIRKRPIALSSVSNMNLLYLPRLKLLNCSWLEYLQGSQYHCLLLHAQFTSHFQSNVSNRCIWMRTVNAFAGMQNSEELLNSIKRLSLSNVVRVLSNNCIWLEIGTRHIQTLVWYWTTNLPQPVCICNLLNVFQFCRFLINRNGTVSGWRRESRLVHVAEVSYFALSFDGEIAMGAISDLVHRSLKIPCIAFCCTSDLQHCIHFWSTQRLICEWVQRLKGLGRK